MNEISGIFAENRLTGDVEGNTHLKGAAIVSFANNIDFTTNTFTYEDIQDRDIQKNWQVSGGLSFSFDGMKADGPASKSGGWDTQNFKHNKDINTSLPTIDGFYEKNDKRQITRATFGEGSLNIRDKAKQAELEQSGKTKKLASLNRNLDNAQEITKDERDYVGVFVSENGVKGVGEVAGAAVVILEKVARHIEKAFEKEPEKLKDAKKLVDEIKKKNVSAEAFEKALNTKCGATQSGFLDLFISRAYANDRVCTVPLELLNGEHIDIDKEVLEELRNGFDNYRAEILEEFANFGQRLIQNRDVLLQSQISDDERNAALQILNGLKYVNSDLSNKSDDISRLYNNLSNDGKRYLFGLLAQEDARRYDSEQNRMADRHGVIQNSPANFWKDTYTGWGLRTFLLSGDGAIAYINGLRHENVPEGYGINLFTGEMVRVTKDDVTSDVLFAAGGSLLGQLRHVKKLDNVGDWVGSLALRPCSFAPDTLVLMADGSYKRIDDIRVGDLVASRNEFTKQYSVRPVTHLPSSMHTDRVTVQVVSAFGKVETIVTTLEHPFYVEGKGFIEAKDLKAGMVLSQWQPKASPLHTVGFRKSEASGALRVKAITVEDDGVPEWRAYNLTVGVDHTYYVGKANVWVHNAGPDCWEVLQAGDAKRLEQIRHDLKITSNTQRKRYLAVAEGHVDGVDLGEIIGISGKRGVGADMPLERRYATKVVGHPRDLDSEVFIFENLYQKLRSTPNAEGTIKIISERTICESCAGVIGQFRKDFPNIKLIIRHGREAK